MNVIIVTTDEPFYLPTTIKNLLSSEAKKHISCIILLPPTAKKRTWKTIIYEQLRFGIIYFLYRSIQFVFFRVLSKLKCSIGGRYFSVESVAKAYGVLFYKLQNINSEESMNIIKNQNPDLIVSLSASQIFSKKVIELPRWGTINVHNAPLPRYQGLMPSFWVLYHGEEKTATTVHYMDTEIDTGDIILQKDVQIEKDETLDSLIKKTKSITVEALLETFNIFLKHDGRPPAKPNLKENATYFSFPTKKEIKIFKKRGEKLLWKNIY